MAAEPSPTTLMTPEQVALFEQQIRQFEKDWLAGQRPAIEEYLVTDAGVRPFLLPELIRIEVEFLRKRGEPVVPEQYLARFPELASDEALMQSLAGVVAGSQPHPSSAVKKSAVRIDKQLVASRLMTESQVKECLKAVAQGGKASSSKFREELLRRGCITRWQWDELERGRTNFYLDGDRYLLLDKIGQGGMGAVFKGRHVRMNRDVAIKVIVPGQGIDDGLIQRFRREVEVSSKLQHEHIVQAFDCGVHEGATFLVLEFVEGSDLASLVKRDGPMPVAEAAAIVMQAAAGLAYAHERGIIHRDIKPQNILLSSGGAVKILDMGLARIIDDAQSDPHTSLTQEGTVMGTIDYMPPEQAKQTRLADGRSDLYSLGGTLFYLLAGTPPFAGGSVLEKLQRLANETPPALTILRPDCPADLSAAVERALAKDPALRFQNAGELVRALRPFAAERIAGRPVVTAAVQTAAETVHSAATAPANAVESDFAFTFLADSTPLKSRPKTSSKFSSRQRWIAGGAVVLVLLGLVGWGLNRRNGSTIAKRSDEGDSRSAKSGAIAKFEKNRPSNFERVLPDHGHFGPVISVAFSPKGKVVATGGLDGIAQIRVAGAKDPLVDYREHRAGIDGVAWSGDGKWVASGDLRGEIHIWESTTGKRLIDSKTKKPLVLWREADGFPSGPTYFACPGMAWIPVAHKLIYFDRSALKCYDVERQEELWKREANGPFVCCSRSGKYVATCGYNLAPVVWDAESGNLLADFQQIDPKISAAVFPAIGFISEDRLAVLVDKQIQLWSILKPELLQEFPVPEALVIGAGRRPWVSFSNHDDRCLIIRKDEVVEVSLKDGSLKNIPSTAGIAHQQAFQPSQYGMPSDWDSRTGKLEFGKAANVPNYSDNLPSEVVGYNVRYGHLIWDLRTGMLVDGFPSDFVSPRMVLLEGERLLYWKANSVATRTLGLRELQLEDSVVTMENSERISIYSLRGFSDDGKRAWCIDQPPHFKVWDAETGKLLQDFECGTNQYYQGWNAMAPNGRLVVSAVNSGRVDIRREGATAPEILTESGGHGDSVMVATDGRRAAVRFFHLDVVQPSLEHLTIWDIEKKVKIATIETGDPRLLDPYRLEFSPSGRYLLASREVWDLQANPPRRQWQAEPDHATFLRRWSRFYRWAAFLPTDQHLVIAQDGQYQIWDFVNDVKLATLFLFPKYEWAFVNHQTGHWNGSNFAQEYLRIGWRVDSGSGEWVTPREYNLRTESKPKRGDGWKNDPEKAGIDFTATGRGEK